MTSAQGYRERKRGGRYFRDKYGEKILYDNKNNLLNKTDLVWVVQDLDDEVNSVWYDYDLAFDQAERIGGYLEKWIVRKK